VQKEIFQKVTLRNPLTSFGALALAAVLLVLVSQNWTERSHFNYPRGAYGTPPLVMKGGDPYIRALMRTITASEANDSQPYTLLYGGERVWDLSRHPDRCVRIVAGPNIGNCTTAAGRYQFLSTTWDKMAKRYHPGASRFLFWKAYSFEPEYQDAVVYSWLSDRQAWGIDISQKLRQGKVSTVLRRLSGTWTSLGYGIENNSMTGYLPQIYQRMLKEELGKSGLRGSLKLDNLSNFPISSLSNP
jgi:muramidase (phage lysozyme)